MSKTSANNNQPKETPAAEQTPAPQPKESRQSSRKAAASAAPPQPPADQAASANPAPQPSASTPGGAEAENGQPAPASLSGLRGADYVKALSSHPLATIEVPLLPNERRGDWERAKGIKIRVTSRQLSAQADASANPWLDRTHALAALVIELQRPGVTRFDQIDLRGSQAREAIERLSDYINQARLRVQAQTGKKWTASHIYLIPLEDV